VNGVIRGVAFPFRIDAGGGVAEQSGDEKIRENIVQILLTNVGERVMRRDYGGGLRQLVHDPNNEALWAVIQHQVAKSIGRLEPRVLLQSLAVTADTRGESSLTISVQYMIRRTRQVQKLSVPIGLGGI
jgi:phage baseplate assembly protein W